MAKQCIYCKVESCAHHDRNGICELESIEIKPCNNCCSGKAEDESCCGSYNMR